MLTVCVRAAGIAGQPPQQVCSIPLGCLAIKAAAPDTAVAQQQQQQQLLQAAEKILATHASLTTPVISTYKQQQQQQQLPPDMMQPVIIGTGGTITTLAALQLKLPVYDYACVHMNRLSQTDVEGLLQQLLLDEGRQR
jgi:exopolyphosphatase/pppGpp-phosphohydrolase